MKRGESIKALLRKVNKDLAELHTVYETSLHDEHVNEELKIAIKNIFENLRSCLDYLAQEIYEVFWGIEKKPERLYFPIRSTASNFNQAIENDFPELPKKSKAVFDILEAVQPYRDPWLGQFNRLNNYNKHQDLVEQTRTEMRQVKVSRGEGSVSWGPGVTFGSGVSILGVPIDPRTQMPVPNTIAKTEVNIWVDFKFREIDQSVLPFLQLSLQKVEKIFRDLEAYI